MLRISRDSNLIYLPLMYFLPEYLIVKCHTLCKLPRKVREIVHSEDLTAVVESDAFLGEIIDASAALTFPHFGFKGWKEHYTGFFPVWKLSYATQLWATLLEKEIGWGLQALFNIPSVMEIPFFEPDVIKEVMERVVKRGIDEQNWQPILDVVKEMPCEEDFEKWNTNVRKSFLRKWYHSRAKIKIISLEACMEDENHQIHEIAADSFNMEESVEADDFVERFKARLSKKDRCILEMRMAGAPYDKIAEIIGYKNHSGVIKRIKKMVEKLEKYEDESILKRLVKEGQDITKYL